MPRRSRQAPTASSSLPYFAGERTPVPDPHARGVSARPDAPARSRPPLPRSPRRHRLCGARHNLEAIERDHARRVAPSVEARAASSGCRSSPTYRGAAGDPTARRSGPATATRSWQRKAQASSRAERRGPFPSAFSLRDRSTPSSTTSSTGCTATCTSRPRRSRTSSQRFRAAASPRRRDPSGARARTPRGLPPLSDRRSYVAEKTPWEERADLILNRPWRHSRTLAHATAPPSEEGGSTGVERNGGSRIRRPRAPHRRRSTHRRSPSTRAG